MATFREAPRQLKAPFAGAGSRNDIPDEQTNPGQGYASFDVGFPGETQIPISAGGIPPRRLDFNGILHDATELQYYLGNGPAFMPFSNVVVNNDGGYPVGAILRPDLNNDGRILMSGVDNNDDNFNADPTTIGLSWFNILGVPDYNPGLNHYPGDLVIWRNQDNNVYRCKKINGPSYAGTQLPSSAEYWELFSGAGGGGGGGTVIMQSYPVGSIFWHAAQTAPAGAVICDGTAYSRTDYYELFALIGTTYGEGDGATTFNVPDLRGEFIRGFDMGRGVDSGRVFGSNQDDGINLGSVSTSPQAFVAGASFGTAETGSAQDGALGSLSLTSSESINETRPRNVALLPCIQWQSKGEGGGGGGGVVGGFAELFKEFFAQTPPENYRVRNGQLISNASSVCPQLYEFLQKPEQTWMLLSEDAWQAASAANPWNGVGGVAKFVLDLANNTIRLPDTRGMYRESSGFNNLSPGDVHGDAIRNLSGIGSIYVPISAPSLYCITQGSGAFSASAAQGNIARPSGPSSEIFQGSIGLDLNLSQNLPTSIANMPRAFGMLGCVYVGAPAS